MKKTFSTAAVLTLIEGALYCDFGEVHELAEFVAGHSIWTHEFADKALIARIKEAIFSQHPALREFSKHIGETWQQALARAEERWGKEIEIVKGDAERTENPLESLERIAPGKSAVVIVEDKP